MRPEHDSIPPLSSSTDISKEKRVSISRRAFEKLLAGFTFFGLADGISGGKLSTMTYEDGDPQDDEMDQATQAQMEKSLEKEVKRIDAEKELTEMEKAKKLVDYLGIGVFFWGIKDLMPKEWIKSAHGGIHKGHYLSMLSLLATKYQMGNEEERHHLMDEIKSNIKAFGIIAGSVAFSEGLNADIASIMEKELERTPKDSEKIAMMTGLSSLLSPMATTVGSASIMRKMSNKLAETGKKTAEGKPEIDPNFAATAVSHISNLSGFLVFGDPPFIAVCEKYGFVEGIKWQLKSTLPLALYSLFSSTAKLNYIKRKSTGMTAAEARKLAITDTKEGLLKMAPLMAKIMTRSLLNAAKYFSGAEELLKLEQNEQGLTFDVGAVLMEKIGNLGKLPFSSEFDVPTGHESADTPEEIKATEALLGHLPQTALKNGVATGSDERNPNVDLLEEVLSAQAFEAKQAGEKLTMGKIFNNTFDTGRIKEALGHNLGDIVNAFPFQAGCTPFLQTGFNDAIKGLEAMDLPEWQREMVMFFMIMVFSMVADNYVACKIGLELFPHKPQIALIAAVQGGSQSAIGNMANIAQFSLDDFPLGKSLAKFHWHADTAAVSAAWALGMSHLQKFLPFISNAPKAVKGAGKEAKKEVKKEGVKLTRRGLFTALK